MGYGKGIRDKRQRIRDKVSKVSLNDQAYNFLIYFYKRLVVYVGHCLHLQVHPFELHLDFLLGSFGCFFDRFVSQVQELPIDHSRARTSNTSHCRSWEHVWYCEGVLEPRKKHFLFYFTQTIFLTNMYISLFQTP